MNIDDILKAAMGILAKARIKLVEDKDEELYKILIDLYHPLLSDLFLDVRRQLIVYSGDRIIGLASVHPAPFIQLALIPGFTGKGLAEDIATMIMKKFEYVKLGASPNMANLPALLAMRNLGGGIYPNSWEQNKRSRNIEDARATLEGCIWPKKDDANDDMQETLGLAIEQAKKLWGLWNKKFEGRKAELAALKDYLVGMEKQD